MKILTAEKIYKSIKSILKKELVILWIFCVLLGFALIILQNKNKLPLGQGDFIFVSILALLIALYRPRWIFFLFVGLIPLENVILASGFLPLQLRPYQFLGGILAVAIAILRASGKLKFSFLKPTWLDWAIFSLVPFSFLALINSPAKSISLKNNLVLLSFVILYYLTRNFARNRKDLIKTVFFFLGSFIIVTIFGFYQVLADKLGAKSFEVMFGRPNSTFTEADWLGIFLCFSLAVFLSTVKFIKGKQNKYLSYAIYFLIFLNFVLLLLTISRSAWIGAAVIVFFYFLSLIPKRQPESAEKSVAGWKEFCKESAIIFFIAVISLAIVHFGKLSKFDIFDRARSAATSEQKITIACESGANIPQIITDTGELTSYGCRHINLEEIEANKSQGKFVAEIFRKDPNVMTRGAIYQKSWEILREHPVSGVGFGTITQKLGADERARLALASAERGAGLNESNIFLQVWAGTGILGLIAFVAVFGYLFIYAFRRVSPICPMNKIIGCPVVKDAFEKITNLFAVLAVLALIIPNLFNAGLFLGIFWLGLATIVSVREFHPR